MHSILKLVNSVCDAEIFSALLRIHPKIWAKKWCGIIQLENLFGKYAEIIFRTFLEARYSRVRFGVLANCTIFNVLHEKCIQLVQNQTQHIRTYTNTVHFIRCISYRLPAPIQLNIFPFRNSVRVFN